MRRARETLDRVLGWVLVALMATAVLNVLWQVGSRFVLGAPSSYTEELARFLLIWIGVLGAGYGVGARIHLALDLVPGRLRGRPRRLIELWSDLWVLAFAVLVLVVGGSWLVYVQLELGQTSAALRVPLGYVYAVLPLTGLVMSFYLVDRIFRAGARLGAHGEAGSEPPATDTRALPVD